MFTMLLVSLSYLVAQRVVERGQHKINGKEVEVSIHQPSKSSPKSQISTGEAPEPACIVRVDGVSRVQSLDTLQYYFENSRRSGGGAVKEFEVFKEDDVAYVTFEEEEGMVTMKLLRVEYAETIT